MAYNGVMTTTSDAILDQDQRDRAKALARERRGWQLAELLVSVGYFTLMLTTGASAALRDWAGAVAPGWWGAFLLFNMVFWGAHFLLSFPLSILGEYHLEKRYGLLKQSFAGWLGDAAKGLVLSAGIMLPLLAALYGALALAPGTWWLWALAGYALVSVVAIVVVPVWLMPLFHKFTPLEDEDLKARLAALAERANMPVAGMFRWGLGEKSTAANAALAGLGATRRIIISDTMLDAYSPDEIEAVLAHEMGHQAHGDIGRLWTVNVAVVGAALFLASLVLTRFSEAWGLAGLADFANLPLLLLVLTGVTLVAMPLLNGYSRRREHAADGFALTHAERPEALATALTKLAEQNLADPEPPAWVEWLLYSHPALGRRVARVREATRQG